MNDLTKRTRTRVNGEARDLAVDPASAAVDVIRDDLGLTGTKVVCGAGVCGACTVLVDGQPTTSCMMPACAMEGRDITTVEHFQGAQLHPVQKAFLAHDGLQCGYCTPGFVVEAIALYERWRAEHGASSPSRDTIALALSGHLCRCGAYVGIYEAVRAACAGEFDDVPIEDLTYPRHEALEKVTGRAQYTTDVHYDGMLVAKLRGSDHAHASVESVDVSRAEAMEGVMAVLDVLDDPHRVVRYAGQPIVAVAAVDEQTALEALAAIDITYQPRAFVTDAVAALEGDAPIVYPEHKKATPNASEGPIPPGKWHGNLRRPFVNKFMSHHKGRAAKALAKAREEDSPLTLVHRTYVAPGQTHTALEPHCCVARWDDEGNLTVHASNQALDLLATEIKRHYHLKDEQLVVLAEHVGGAFGAKQGFKLENAVAIDLAREAQAPVKLVFDRHEEMVIGGYRPMARIETAIVSDADARQLGITARSYGNSGVAVQSQNAPWIRFTYDGPKDCEDYDVTTNTSPARPMRGPSGPSAFWALEQSVDEMAHELGVDPIALRRKWEHSDVRDALYDWVEGIDAWRDRKPAGSASGRFRRGVGVAIGNWFTVFHNATRMKLDASRDGLVASCATQDMGNGSRSLIGKAIADEMGVPFHQVRVDIGNSQFVTGPAASASRSTPSLFPVCLEACEMLQKALVKHGKKHLGLEHPKWAEHGIAHDDGHLPLARVLETLEEPISVTSHRRGGNSSWDILGAMPSGDLGASIFFKMTGSICLVDVVVDTRLGHIKPQKVWLGMTVGKIVHPQLARSQAYGGVIQSLGYALTEERIVDEATGQLLTAGLEDYRIPGIGDVPEIEVFFEESGFDKLRGGAVGMSELSTLATPAAVANAVFNATGWRPTEAPMRPHRVLAGLATVS